MENKYRVVPVDNQDLAVLMKVNELAERHGLKSYDFVAVFKSTGEASHQYELHFEVPASGNALREERFDKMMKDLGTGAYETGILKGETSDIIDALDKAIAKSPRSRLK